jgi:thiol-disulfide isomerase/thioredoxin
MALTESNHFEIGKTAPSFNLLDTISDKNHSLSELKGKNGTVIMFICNHCPFVIYVNEQLVKLANDYLEKGIGFIAISSNDVGNYHQDGPQYMKRVGIKLNYPFPYLYDESQNVAKQYDAACTPDFYIFDENLKSVYHGQLDNSRPGNGIPVTGNDIRNALDKLLSGEENTEIQKPSMGCGIKWK